MTKEEREEAIAIIRKEYLCVDRDCDIERNCGKCDLMMPSKEPILKAYKTAIQALEQEPKTGWIPVSERLPKAEYGESGSVLVCFENETQDVLYFDGSNWRYPTGEIYVSINHKNGWHNKVIAWMPLPTPYEPQERSEKE